MSKSLSFTFLSVALFATAYFVSAASVFDIGYPIQELGGCADRAACKQYCDNPENKEICVSFGRKYGLIEERAAKTAETLAEEAGPGGCVSEKECRQYCGDSAHTEECIAFASKKGIISKEEQAEIRKEQEKFKELQSEAPGGCKSQEECRAYCENPDHIDECLAFAEKHGFVSKEEAARVKKAGITTGPGECKGQDACRAFCQDPSHQEECIAFGEKHGFMSREEAERARKFTGQTGPGGCRGEKCRTYCEDPAHAEACLEHAEKEGLIPKEDAARAKKFLKASEEGGPGGCRGIQCKQYCDDPAHREECFSFAKKQGLMSVEEEKQFSAGKKIQETVAKSGGPGGCKSDDECRAYCANPEHVEECVAFGAAHGGMSEQQTRQMLKDFTERKFSAGGEFHSSRDLQQFQEESGKKFEEYKALEAQFRGQSFPQFEGGSGQKGFPGQGIPGQFPGGPQGESRPQSQMFSGPGGCTSPDGCIKYCAEHRDECFKMGSSPHGGPQGGHQGGSSQGKDHDKESGYPQLRSDLIREYQQKEFPQMQGQREQGMSSYGKPQQGEGQYPARSPMGSGQGEILPPKDGFPMPSVPFSGSGDSSFKGIGPGPGTTGALDPLYKSQPQGRTPSYPPKEGSVQYPSQYQQPSGSPEGMYPYHPPQGSYTQPDQYHEPSSQYPQQYQQPYQQQPGQYPQQPTQYQQEHSGGTMPPSYYQYQPPSGGTPPPTSYQHQPPPAGTPPPSETMPPPSFTSPPPESMPSPPPSGYAPSGHGFFASILDFLLGPSGY